MLLLLLLACLAPDAPPEGQRFAAALRLAHTAPVEALAQCTDLGTLRGECITAVAAAQAGTDGMDALSVCEEIGDPTWQAECRFEVVEGAITAEPAERAAACAAAEPFARRCRLHLWNEVAQDLLASGSLEEAVAAFRPHLDWAPEESDIAWNAFWEAQLQPRGHTGPVHYDLTRCEALVPRDQRPCRKGVEAAFRRATQLVPPHAPDGFCDANTPQPERLAKVGLHVTPAPALDHWTRRLDKRLCQQRAPEVPSQASSPR